MTQLINKPTRIAPPSATLLDIIATNKPVSVIHSDSIPCSVGDHELVSVTINLRKPKRQPVVKSFRQMKNYSPHILCNLLLSKKQSFDKIFATDNVDFQVQIFTENVLICLNSCAPKVIKEIQRPFAPWITDDLKILMQERDSIQEQFKFDRNNVELRDRYKLLKKQVKS